MDKIFFLGSRKFIMEKMDFFIFLVYFVLLIKIVCFLKEIIIKVLECVLFVFGFVLKCGVERMVNGCLIVFLLLFFGWINSCLVNKLCYVNLFMIVIGSLYFLFVLVNFLKINSLFCCFRQLIIFVYSCLNVFFEIG